MAKLIVGEPLLVKGPSHIEKALVKSIEKDLYILDNGLKINSSLEIKQGINNSKFIVTPFDEVEYNYEISKLKISRYTNLILSNYKDLKDNVAVIRIANKLEKICNRYINK